MKTISPSEIEEVLLHFAKSMNGLDSEEDLLWDMVKNCISILGFEDAVIYVLDDTGEYLIQKAALGPKNPQGKEVINALKIPIGKGITGRVAQTGLPLLISDTRSEPDYIHDDQYRLSELSVPILLGGKVIGGYPRIIQIREDNIRILAQKKPGQSLRFSLVADLNHPPVVGSV